MAPHTPGPWDAHQRNNGRWFIKVRGSQNGRKFLSLSAEGNARLVAAAPDLLAALQGLLAQFDCGAFVRNTERDVRPDWPLNAVKPVMALAAAEAAIAKAVPPETEAPK